MSDHAKELENRLNRLEDKMKASLLEVEKRFEMYEEAISSMDSAMKRVRDAEDMLLLLQIDVAKLKDVAENTEPVTVPQNIYTRPEKIEEEITIANEEEKPKISYEEQPSIGSQLDEIERRLEELEKTNSAGGLFMDSRKILRA